MKRCFIYIFLLFSLFSFSDYVVLNLKGVHCEKGAKTVEKALLSVKGVEEVKIDIKKAICTVKYDPEKTNPKALVEEVNKTNYKAEIQGSYTCPSVGIKEIDDFHSVLHTMHEAVNEKKYEVLRDNISELLKRAEVLKTYAGRLLENAKDDTEKTKCQEISNLTEEILKNIHSLESSLKDGKEAEILKNFDLVHENFYKILEKSE